jgi:hypothetical protein
VKSSSHEWKKDGNMITTNRTYLWHTY